MNHLGIEVSMKNIPELDPGFIPLAQFNRAFLAGADKPLDVAVERSNGQVAVWHVKVHSDPAFAAADIAIVVSEGDGDGLMSGILAGNSTPSAYVEQVADCIETLKTLFGV